MTEISTEIPAVAYVRVSTEEQAKEGISLEAQQARIESYCKLQGLTLTKIFTDAGVSGSKRIEQRPAGQELLRFLYQIRQAKGVVNMAVVAIKLDRLFRNTVDCLMTYEEWRKRGIAIHLANEGGNCIDTSTAIGAMVFTMRAMQAQFERDMTSERTRFAMAAKRAKSERQSGRIPYGFDEERVPDGKRFNEDGSPKLVRKLVPNKSEQEVIQAINELCNRGVSYHGIARGLNEQGIKTKTGRGLWCRSHIKGIRERTMRDRRIVHESQAEAANT